MNCGSEVISMGVVYQLLNMQAYDAHLEARLWVEFGVPVTVGAGHVLTYHREPREDGPGYRALYQTMVRAYLYHEPICRELFLIESNLIAVPRAARLRRLGGPDALLVDFLSPACAWTLATFW